MVYLKRTREYLLHLKAEHHTYAKASDLRKGMTEAERVLWDELKNRKLLGFKFRRQHPLKWFIADFIAMKKDWSLNWMVVSITIKRLKNMIRTGLQNSTGLD